MRPSLGWPITLGVVMIVLLVALTIGWIIVTVAGFQATNRSAYVAVLAVGTTFLVLVLVGVVLYLLLTIKAINLNQRQANFIDSVTHELKSPIASLKLYLQTLDRHKLTDAQRNDFHRFMVEDLERLDRLIDHMLDAARLDQQQPGPQPEDTDLRAILTQCSELVCLRYRRPPETIQLELQPATVFGRAIDLDMIFRNLLDNAVKYSGDAGIVQVQLRSTSNGKVLVRIADNGPGIPLQFRRKVFSRFFRLGDELERTQPGTGLGLFIVGTLVKRMRGKISIRGRGSQPGTIFEVELPGGVRSAISDEEKRLA